MGKENSAGYTGNVLASTAECCKRKPTKSYDYLFTIYADPGNPLEVDISMEKGECLLHDRPISNQVDKYHVSTRPLIGYERGDHVPLTMRRFEIPPNVMTVAISDDMHQSATITLFRNQRLADENPVSGKVTTFLQIPVEEIRRNLYDSSRISGGRELKQGIVIFRCMEEPGWCCMQAHYRKGLCGCSNRPRIRRSNRGNSWHCS